MNEEMKSEVSLSPYLSSCEIATVIRQDDLNKQPKIVSIHKIDLGNHQVCACKYLSISTQNKELHRMYFEG